MLDKIQRYAGLVAFLIAFITIGSILGRWAYLEKRTKELKIEVQTLGQSLTIEKENKENQVKALEELNKKQKTNNELLIKRVTRLERSNEKAKCAMPEFMRDAFNGVSR